MAKQLKLHQIVAAEQGNTASIKEALTRVHKEFQHKGALEGLERKYEPLSDDPSSPLGELLPGESKLVQVRVWEEIARIVEEIIPLHDLVATKDHGNMQARADVSLEDGTVLMKEVPVTHLIWLEKKMVDVHTFVAELPTLPPTELWEWDQQQDCFRSRAVKTARTKKFTDFVVVPNSGVPEKGIPPTVKEVQVDKIAGYWTSTGFSGAIPAQIKAEMLRRVKSLQTALKLAREKANSIEIEQKKESATLLRYIFGNLKQEVAR